jgi:hypothetical protein
MSITNGGQLASQISNVMKAISGQHFLSNSGIQAPKVNITNRFILNGLTATYSGSSFMMTAGQMQCNVLIGGSETLTLFNIPPFTFSPAYDGAWSVSFLYLNSDNLTEITPPTIITYPGLSCPVNIGFTDTQVAPLYSVTALNGQIVGALFRGSQGGIQAVNLNNGIVQTNHLASNPFITTAPALASGTMVSGPTYLTSGSGTYDALITFTLSTANPNWLAAVRMYVVIANTAYATNRRSAGDLTPTASGSYSPILSLTAGTAFDIYCTFIDLAGNESCNIAGVPIGLKLCTTSPNPIVPSSSFPAMPSGTSPILSNSPTIAYPYTGGGSFDAQSAVALVNGSSTVSNWLEAIQCVAQPSTTSANWTVYNEIEVNNTGIYSLVWGGLGAGTSYTLGFRYKDYVPNLSNVFVVGNTATNPIQSSAISPGSIDVTKMGPDVFDSNGQLVYIKNTPATQLAINANGTVVAGQVTGQLPVGTNSANVVSTIGTVAVSGANGISYLNSNTVNTNAVQQVAVLSTSLAQSCYATITANTAYGSNVFNWVLPNSFQLTDQIGNYLMSENGTFLFSEVAGTTNVTTTPLVNGSTIIYDVGSGQVPLTSTLVADTMYLNPTSVATLQYKHTAFKSGSAGQINVNFIGTAASSTSNAIAQTSLITGSGQPSITQQTTNTNNAVLFTTPVSASLSSSIVATPNPITYTQNRHNNLYNNNNTVAQLSGAVFTDSLIAAYTPMSGTITTPTCYSKASGGSFILSGGGLSALKTYTINLGTVSSAYPVHLSFTSITSANDSNCGDTLFYILSDGAGNNIWTAYVATGSTPFGPSTVSQTFTSGVPGTWTVQVGASSAARVNTAAYTQIPTVSYIGSVSGTSGSTVGTSPTNFYLYDTVYTVPNTQIEVNVNSTNYITDSHGNVASVEIIIQNTSTSAWCINTTAPAASSIYTYAGDANGIYYVWMRAIAQTNGSGFSGTTTLYPNAIFQFYYYSNDANALTYTYPVRIGNTSTCYTDKSSSSYAPVTATPIGFVVQSYSETTPNTNGAATAQLAIYDPNGNNLATLPISGVGNYSYSNPAAINGQYKMVLTNNISTNTMAGSGVATYTASVSGYVYNYDLASVTNTLYSDNSSTFNTFLTASQIVAPTTAAVALGLNLTSVTTDTSGIFGTNYLVVRLKNPAGAYVTDSSSLSGLQYSLNSGATWYGVAAPGAPWVTDGGIAVVYGGPIQIRYFNASAISGVYSWICYFQCNANNSGTQQYSDSFSGSQTYYLNANSGGNVYILSGNGQNQRIGTNDGDIDWIGTPKADSCSFNVFNSGTTVLPFAISIEVIGV